MKCWLKMGWWLIVLYRGKLFNENKVHVLYKFSNILWRNRSVNIPIRMRTRDVICFFYSASSVFTNPACTTAVGVMKWWSDRPRALVTRSIEIRSWMQRAKCGKYKNKSAKRKSRKSEVEYSVLYQPEIVPMKCATTFLGITVVKCISSI